MSKQVWKFKNSKKKKNEYQFRKTPARVIYEQQHFN